MSHHSPDQLTSNQQKSSLRAQVRAARRSLSEACRVARDEAVDAQVRRLAEEFGAGDAVTSYLPSRLEPGTAKMADGFCDRGVRVLTPVVLGPQAPLGWQTDDSEETLPPESLALARLVLVPALAVDRRGVRLGQGGGHYDRSLGYAASGARLVAVVGEGELMDELPAQAHDRRVGWALTPDGLVCLG